MEPLRVTSLRTSRRHKNPETGEATDAFFESDKLSIQQTASCMLLVFGEDVTIVPMHDVIGGTATTAARASQSSSETTSRALDIDTSPASRKAPKSSGKNR